MKISARNQFQGKVVSVVPGAVNTEVNVALSAGQQIVSIVTNQSAKALKLEAGNDVIALVKASSVLVMTEDAGLTLSARNCLAGEVKSLSVGPVHAEVAIAVDGGDEVHASITHQAATELGLKEGATATAVFKASSVILGVPS